MDLCLKKSCRVSPGLWCFCSNLAVRPRFVWELGTASIERSSVRWKPWCTSLVLQNPNHEFFLGGFVDGSEVASDFTALWRTFKAQFKWRARRGRLVGTRYRRLRFRYPFWAIRFQLSETVPISLMPGPQTRVNAFHEKAGRHC